MSQKWMIVSAVAVVGLIMGSSMGIAFGGGVAINGAIVVAGIAGFIAFLLVPNPKDAATKAHRDGSPSSSESIDELSRTGVTIGKHLGDWVGSVLRAIWNLEMRVLEVAGVMPLFQLFPILFAIVGTSLLLFVFPLGAIFVATAVSALLRNPKATQSYKVSLA